MDIDSLRNEIDRIDEKILTLLTERARYALTIGQYKMANKIAVHNKEREDQVMQNLLNKNTGPLRTDDIRKIYESIIFACRNLQF